MTIEQKFAKKGLELFKQYLRVVYHISYKTFKSWTKEDQEYALNDFFSA